MANTIQLNIKKTILEFIKDLKDNVFIDPIEQGELAMVEHMYGQKPAAEAANHVVIHVLPHEQKIKSRDLNFFIAEKDTIFEGLPEDRVDYFARLVKLPEAAGGLSNTDKATAWSYFDTLISLAKDFKKYK